MIREQCNSCQYDLNCSNQSRMGNKYDNTVCEDYEGPINNSDGMFKRVFTYKGRIRRLEFGISYIIYCILYFFRNYSNTFCFPAYGDILNVRIFGYSCWHVFAND